MTYLLQKVQAFYLMKNMKYYKIQENDVTNLQCEVADLASEREGDAMTR